MFKISSRALCAAAMLCLSSAAVYAQTPPRPASTPADSDAAGQAAEIQRWIRDLMQWAAPYIGVFQQQRSVLSAIGARVGETLSDPSSRNPAELKPWADNQRAALAALESKIETLRGGSAPPAPPAFVADGRLKGVMASFSALPDAVADQLPKNFVLARGVIDELEAAARGDPGALSNLRQRTLDLGIAVTEGEDTLLQIGIAGAGKDQPEGDIGAAELETNLASLDVQRFAVAELFGEGPRRTRAEVAAGLRTHAASINALADAIDRDASAWIKQLSKSLAAKTPLLERLPQIGATYAESASIQREIAQFLVREATRIEDPSVTPLQAVGDLRELPRLAQRQRDLANARMTLVTQ